MKILGSIALAGIASVMMVGCASRVYVQTDESTNLAKYKTYMWVQTRANQDDNRNTTSLADQGIHAAVNAELSQQGFTEVTQNPDVLVSYDILLEKSTQRQSDPVYTQPFSRVYYNPYMRRWGTVYYPSQFVGCDTYDVPVREGTVTVTLIDPNSDKSVWQAWTTETLDSRKITNEEISRSVHNIFKKFDK